MNSLVGFVGAVIIGSMAICDLCPQAASAPIPATAAGVEALPAVWAAVDTRTVRLRIEGMTCGGCAISARIVLERLEGVEKAEVDYDRKVAVVRYDAAKVTPERMIEALEAKLKYTATVIEEPAQ